MRTIETENVQFRRFVFASRRYAREKERALSSVILEREPFGVPLIRFQKSRGLSSIATSRPITIAAFHLARDLPRDPSSARAARPKFIYARARLSSLARVATAPRDDGVIHHHDHRSVDRDRRCRRSINRCRRAISISIARARDARHAPVDIDVKRFLSHRRHDRRNRSERRARVGLTTRVETTGCVTTRGPPTDATVFF